MKFPSPNRSEKIARRRYKAIRRVGYPKRWPDEIAAEQKWKCHYCGVNMTRDEGQRWRTLDHVVPISRGGKSNRRNLVACCYACNQEKADRTGAEFMLDATA